MEEFFEGVKCPNCGLLDQDEEDLIEDGMFKREHTCIGCGTTVRIEGRILFKVLEEGNE